MIMDLWTLLVETIFGSFWLAVIGMVIIMFLIMAMGRISAWTNLTYQGIFLFVMSIGYGYRLFSIIIWVGLMIWCWSEINKFFKMEY